MSPGSHAAPDGSFRRSAGMQFGRAAILIVVAVLIGVVLLHRTSSPSGAPLATGGTPTTKPAAATTTTVPPSSTTTTIPLRSPATITVQVANGAGITNLATKLSTVLHARGYDTLSPADATVHVPLTIVYYQAAFKAEAIALARAIGLTAVSVQSMPAHPPVSFRTTADILVVAGADVATVAGATSSSGTSTTSSHTTSTT